MEVKNILSIAQAIIELSKDKEWGEEELAKAIKLLHRQFEDKQLVQFL